MRSWVLLVVAACGSNAPAPPPTVKPPPPAPAPTVATCADAGVILRGPVSANDEKAGRAREQTIEKSCREDKWPQAVIDCIAGTAQPKDCLAQLPEETSRKYSERLAAWDETYGDPYAADGSYQMQPAVVDCSDILNDVSNYPPVLDAKADAREWQVKVRKAFLAEACEHDWTDELKSCINGAMNQRVAIEACIEEYKGADERDLLVRVLGDFGELAKKIEAAKKKPASIGCKQVTAAHYADATWKKKLEGYTAAERKKMIAESRALMAKACTTDTWDETMRACLVAGGEDDVCFDDANKRKWGYPATGAVTTVGIAECDAYSTKVLAFAACNTVEKVTRDSIVRSQQQMLAEIARMSKADRGKMGTSCKAAMEAIEMSLTNAGC